MHNKIMLNITLSGLFIATQMTMTMDPELLSSSVTSTQPLSMQSGRTKRSQSNPPSTLYRSLSASPIDDYDDTKYVSSSSSRSGSQPNSPRKQEVNPAYLEIAQTLQAHGCLQQQQYTGYYTNKINNYKSKLPIHTLIESTSASNNADYISYKNNQTNELATILFHSNMTYNKQKYIVVVGHDNRAAFIIKNNPNDATKTEETPQNSLLRQQSIETLKKLKNSCSNSSNSSNSDGEKDKKVSTAQQEIKSIESMSSKQSNLDNGTRFKRTIIGVSFVAFCIAIAYQYRKLPDAFAKFIDNFLAQCSNLIPSNFAR